MDQKNQYSIQYFKFSPHNCYQGHHTLRSNVSQYYRTKEMTLFFASFTFHKKCLDTLK